MHRRNFLANFNLHTNFAMKICTPYHYSCILFVNCEVVGLLLTLQSNWGFFKPLQARVLLQAQLLILKRARADFLPGAFWPSEHRDGRSYAKNRVSSTPEETQDERKNPSSSSHKLLNCERFKGVPRVLGAIRILGAILGPVICMWHFQNFLQDDFSSIPRKSVWIIEVF